MSRTDMPSTWDERAMLTTFLDYARATAVAKCADLSAPDAARAPLPGSPLMTVGGLISHLRWVEYFWFRVVFLGEKEDAPWTAEEPDREMTLGAQTPLADLLADYQEQCDGHRELVAANDLAATAKRSVRDGTHVTLGWILMHLIEETSRHNGHLDILREMADGVTGV